MDKAALNRWASRLGTTAILLLTAWGVVVVALKQMGYQDAARAFAWATAIPALLLVPTVILVALIIAILAYFATPKK